MAKIKLCENGMTLVELVMATAIMTLLMTAMSIMVIRVYDANKYVIEQGLNNHQLQNSIRSFSTNLREARQSDAGGYLIESADDFDLVFFANIDDDQDVERVHYYLDGQQLKMGTAKAAGFPAIYPEADEEVITVGNGIVNTSSQPIFYYYNRDYPEDQTTNLIETPAAVEEISLVKIDVFANINPNHIPDQMRMETFVKPRNIE